MRLLYCVLKNPNKGQQSLSQEIFEVLKHNFYTFNVPCKKRSDNKRDFFSRVPISE